VFSFESSVAVMHV